MENRARTRIVFIIIVCLTIITLFNTVTAQSRENTFIENDYGFRFSYPEVLTLYDIWNFGGSHIIGFEQLDIERRAYYIVIENTTVNLSDPYAFLEDRETLHPGAELVLEREVELDGSKGLERVYFRDGAYTIAQTYIRHNKFYTINVGPYLVLPDPSATERTALNQLLETFQWLEGNYPKLVDENIIAPIIPSTDTPTSLLAPPPLQFPFCGRWQISRAYHDQPNGHPNDQYNRYAIDFVYLDGQTQGAPVYAAHDGTVTYAWDPTGGGNTAKVRWSSQTYLTFYAHLLNAEQLLPSGTDVQAGSLIAYADHTGTQTTGPHLHFAFWDNNQSIVPEPMSGQSGFYKGQIHTRICVPSPTPTPTDNGSVGGLVKVPNGDSVANATVKVVRGSDSQTTTTSQNGTYLFSSVPSGPGQIIAVKEGVGSGQTDVTVLPYQTVQAPPIVLFPICLSANDSNRPLINLGCEPPTPNVDNAAYVADITLPDGTVITPGQSVTKTWRMRNTGTSTWSSGYQLVFRSGDRLGAPESVNVPSASPTQAVNISVPLQVPGDIPPGTYSASWQLRNAQGTYFGEVIWFELVVSNEQPPTGNGVAVDLVNISVPSSVAPGQSFIPEVTVRITGGQLQQGRGDMLRHYSGTNYSDFPHVAVEGTHSTGSNYTFRFYDDHPMIAPSTSGTYESRWRVWANGGWVGPEIAITFTVYQADDNEPPNPPTLTSPADWAVLVGENPTLCAESNGDPDGDTITHYRFVIFESAQNYDSGWVTSNCVTPEGLGHFTYQWHAQVRDSGGAESDWSASRHFTLESSTVEITDFHFEPDSPSNVETVICRACTAGCGGVGVGLKVMVNTATDGSANGAWRVIKELGVPCFNSEDAPRWETLEYAEGTHLVRLVARSCDGTEVIEDRQYTLLRGKPSRPFLQSPAQGYWSNSPVITFTWGEALRANDYTLIVGTTPNPEDNPVLTITTPSTSYTATFGSTYAQLYWRVYANNEYGRTRENGRWVGLDVQRPSSAIDTAQTPSVVYDTQFPVVWSGTDDRSGIHTYEVQIQQDQSGTWSPWLTGYSHSTAIFSGHPGQTYCFRTAAQDVAGNIEAYPASPDRCVTVDPTQRPNEPWWDIAYAYRRTIVVANRMDSVALPSGYPIKLFFDTTTTPTAAEIYAGSTASVKGQDVRVVFNNETELARHILQFTPLQVEIWIATRVEIPSNGSSRAYALYYGNVAPDAAPAEPTDVFSPSPDGQTDALWYFEESFGETPDMSGNGRDIAWSGIPDRSSLNGIHGRGVRLRGEQWGTVPAFGTEHLTLEGWVWFDSLTNPAYPAADWTGIIAGWSNTDNRNRWYLSLQGYNGQTSELRGQLEIIDAQGVHHDRAVYSREVRIETGRWYHVAMTYDGTTQQLWVDGVLVDALTFPGRVDTRVDTVFVGRNHLDHPPMIGRLDGLRVSRVARTTFPYGMITVAPSVATGQAGGQTASGPTDVVLETVTAQGSVAGDMLIEATLSNQGTFPTYNEFFVHLYRDYIPTGPGDLSHGIGFWVNSQIDPGERITLTTRLTAPQLEAVGLVHGTEDQTFILSAQADSTGVVGETNNSNNIVTGISACIPGVDRYEPDDTVISATPFTVNLSQAHNAHQIGDNDWVKFNASAGQAYVLRTGGLALRADTLLTLYDTDGRTPLATNDDDAGTLASRVVWRAPRTGTYFVQVRHWNPGAGGCETAYTLSISTSQLLFLPLVQR